MKSANIFFGFKCLNCKQRVQMGIGQSRCPSCGCEMVADNDAKPVALNVLCNNCKTFFSMVLSEKCPKCKTPFSNIS